MSTTVQSYGSTDDPEIWLLICYECKTIDELPVDNVDLLQVCIDRNHIDAVTQREHVGQLHRVPIKHWADPTMQAKIQKQMQEKGSPGLAAVDAEFYDNRSTFFDDAMACFKKHNRPKGRCPDWRIDSKRLIPSTAKDRKELGLAKPSETGPKVYLCDFCPAKTYMVAKAREAAGQYDD